jgi:hypothetical protein
MRAYGGADGGREMCDRCARDGWAYGARDTLAIGIRNVPEGSSGLISSVITRIISHFWNTYITLWSGYGVRPLRAIIK